MSMASTNGAVISQDTNETVTATVTRTITTTDAEGQTTTVYTTTDEKVAKLGGDADDTTPVAVSSVKHTEQVSTTTGVDDLNANLLAAIEKQNNDAAGADSDIMRMLSGMLQAGLQSKGPPSKRVAPKQRKDDPMAAARGINPPTNGVRNNTTPQPANNTQQNQTNGAGHNPPAQTNNAPAGR